MKIIFMGTSEFAVPALKALIETHEVMAVFTQSPKPKDRGHILQASPVNIVAGSCGIKNIYTPSSLLNIEIQALIESIPADLIVVVSYGFIIPKIILNMKKYGAVNIHPSLLPKFRGAAPLHHVILSGDDISAVSIIQMDTGVDTGPIVKSEIFDMPCNIYLKDLSEKTANIGARLLLEYIEDIDIIKPISQNTEGASYASKSTKINGEFSFNDDAEMICRKVRAFHLWPCAYTKYKDSFIKINNAHYLKIDHHYDTGMIVDIIEGNLHIACGKNILIIEKLTLPGKDQMTGLEFALSEKLNNLSVIK